MSIYPHTDPSLVASVAANDSVDLLIPDEMAIEELVARVAVRRLRRAVNATQDEAALFALFDFEGSQTRRIVEAIHQAEPAARIAIHPDVLAGPVPPEWISSQPLTHWRNVAREDHDRAIVSAVTADALNRLGETAATIHRLSPDHLKADLPAWIAAGSHFEEQTPRNLAYLNNAITGLLRTDIPANMPLFARFMNALDHGVGAQAPHKALNRALTVLKIPPDAANFSPASERGRLTSPESWAAQLTELYNRVSDIAYLRDDQGRPLDRAMLHGRVDALEVEGELDEHDVARWRDLLDDPDIEPGEWRPSQEAFVGMRWPLIQKVVKARKTVREAPLGQATVAYLDKEHSDALTNVDRDILDRLDESRSADADEAELFGRHRAEIEKDKKLFRRWEQFVFRDVRNHSDLLAGIVRTSFDLVSSAPGGSVNGKTILFRLSKSNELEFWRRHLLEACLTLRDRYRGIDTALPASVRVDCGLCWTRDWADEIEVESGHQGSDAEFKFEAFLLASEDFEDDGSIPPAKLTQAVKSQMVWSPTARSLSLNFADHLRAVAPQGAGSALQLSGLFSRTAKDSTSGTRSLKLADRRTIDDIHGNDEGQLFDPNIVALNLGRSFTAELEELTARRVIREDGRAAIDKAYEHFRVAYSGAIDAFICGNGAFDPLLLEQGRRYGDLLATLRAHAHSDACRRGLWRTAMHIGTAASRNVPGSLLTPFAPLRLAEIGLRARMLADTLATIGDAADDPHLRPFVLRAEADLQRSWFTDFQIGASDDKILGMIENNFLEDYSYLEPIGDGAASGEQQGAYTRQAAENLMKVLSEHLDLHPHNAANFSVVLYNSESRDLPSAVAERLARRVDEDARLRCDLVIASDDRRRLRQIYAEQNVSIGRELESSGGADLTKEFLSNLRVGIGDIEKLATSESDTKPLDVAFLQDVFARNAKTRWRTAQPPAGGWADIDLATRDAPSRRMVQLPGENRTRVLLVTPTRPAALQHYLDLAMEMVPNEVEDPSRRDHWEPLREISFDNKDNAEIIRRAHDIADWVVTFDAIADQQLIRQNGISVIRSVPIDETRHNLVVSTCAHRRSLTQRIAEMISDVTSSTAAEETGLAQLLISRAADLSGQIVLRAANRDQAALELIGLSLSEQLVRSSMPEGSVPIAWFFLDDFKTRVGHAAGDVVADLLLVSAGDADEGTLIRMTVVEAKYVEYDGRGPARAKSRLQTETSVDRISKRYAMPDILNAKSHAAQLADLLVEHGSIALHDDAERLRRWIGQIRAGAVTVEVEGLSLIFVHDDDENQRPPTIEPGFRQIFHSRADIERLLSDVRSGRPSAPLPDRETAEAPSETGPKSDTQPDIIFPLPGLGDGTCATKDASLPPKEGGDTHAPSAPTVEPADELVPAEDAPEGVAQQADRSAGSFLPGVAGLVEQRGIPVAEVAGQEWLLATERQLRGALKGYGMTCETAGSRLTPNSALIRFRGNDAMTTDLVQKRISTLLTSHGLEIVAVRPAKGEVVVMVARDGRVILPTLDLWKRRQLPDSAPYRNTSFVLGEREDSGEILYLNLSGPFAGQPQHGPHTLIAGETGGGKGIFTSNLLLDICATNSPSAARVRLVDPKAGIDYGWIEQVPHLDGPIVTTPDAAIAALKDLVEEMQRRYDEVLGPRKLPNIDAFNALVDERERLPRIYFFHDELADWIADKSDTQYRDAVSDYVVRLSGKARAAGIHLFLVTQRPDKDALPGLIKANMGNKIALKVSNRLNSQIILDEPGAEGLLGHGHMIAKLANQPGGMIYAQAPYLDPAEAAIVAQAIAKG